MNEREHLAVEMFNEGYGVAEIVDRCGILVEELSLSLDETFGIGYDRPDLETLRQWEADERRTRRA